MPIYLAAQNSSDRDKLRADEQCQNLASSQIQQAADEAAKSADALIFAPGFYRLEKGLQVNCELRGVGYANLSWAGDEPDAWMVQTTRVVSGLYFYCHGKARALKVVDAHNVTFENLHIFNQGGAGLRIEKGWCLTVRNVRSLGGTGQAFRFEGFNGSIGDQLTAVDVRGATDGVLYCQGQGDLRQLAIEQCNGGPAVVLDDFLCGSLDGLWTENIIADSIVRVQNTKGARISRLSHWQRPENQIPMAVEVIKSQGVEVDGVVASNIRDAIVRIDADSNLGGCTARNIVDCYGKLRPDSAGYKSVVQPKHIVDVRGFDHEPVKEQTETDERKD